MRIFKNRRFASFARKEKISDADLCEAVARAERGLIDADLGGGVIKQRIARREQGKSGGFRSLILFRVGERAIFAFGFAKSDMDNIRPSNMTALKVLAKLFLNYDNAQFEDLINRGELTEVICHEENL